MSDYGMVTFDRGHTDDCWKWHHECARAEIMFLNSYIDGINQYVVFLEDLIEGSGQPLPEYNNWRSHEQQDHRLH